MSDLSKIDDKDLVAELTRRKKIKKAQAWKELEKLKSQMYDILHEHHLSTMKWGSCTLTIEEETEEFFESLWGACGGNDIGRILGESL